MSKHQFAREKDGRWVNAQKTVYNKMSRYVCECPQRHVLKLVKPSGKLGKRKFCDYFAHVTKKQKMCYSTVKNKENPVQCSGSGESVDHRMAKHRLREMQGLFTFPVQQCPRCKTVAIEEDCSGGKIHIEVRSVDAKWRYDCLLVRNDGSKLALEIVHTHYTTDAKVHATRLSGVEIAEFRASEVLNMTSAGVRLNNLLVRQVKCLHCMVLEGLEWFRDLYVEEFWIIWNFESLLEDAYFMGERKLLKKIEMKRVTSEAELKWMSSVWESENWYIRELEYKIDEGYAILWRILEFQKSIHGISPLEAAKRILREYAEELCFIVPTMGEIEFDRVWKEDENGVYIKRENWWASEDNICNKWNDIYVYMFDDDCDIKWNLWKPDGIERNFVIFLRTFKVIGDLPMIEYKIRNHENAHAFKDCRWPILKQRERTIFGVCANCGIPRHTSEICRLKNCLRCGRKGHLSSRCFAKTHVNGGLI